MRAVQIKVSQTLLKELLKLPVTNDLKNVRYDGFRDEYTFVLEGVEYPEVLEGCEPKEAHVIIIRKTEVKVGD